MQANKLDRLAILRAKYKDAIASKEAETAQLREKLKLLDELETEAQSIVASTGQRQQTNDSPNYGEVTITKAIMDAMQNIGLNGGVSASDIRKYIEAHGYKATEKYFNQTVSLTLRRLARAGKIDTAKVDERRVYKAKT
jgi:hypothetical protein